MNSDISKVESVTAVTCDEREVAAVNVSGLIVVFHLPVARLYFDYVTVIFIFVHKGENAFC